MSDALLLLFLQRLLPGWSIRLERGGLWRAKGRVHITASSRDGLVDALAEADPEGLAGAIRVLEELDR